jgi:hypothetical protein
LGVRLSSLKSESNMENSRGKIVIAPQFIKEKTFITDNGEVINNTEEDPRAVERYLRARRGL